MASHAGFGRHSPSSVPGVLWVGRMTGTPQGQLLPGLWPEEQVGASKTVCLSTCCSALLPGTKAVVHQRASGEKDIVASMLPNKLPSMFDSPSFPVPSDGSMHGSYCSLSFFLCFFKRIHFLKCLSSISQNAAKKKETDC